MASSNWWLANRKGTPAGFTLAGSESNMAWMGLQLSRKFKRKKKGYLGVNSEY